jgi:hemerythrin-like domain-containing protein
MKRHESLIPLSHQHHNGLALCVIVERALARDASPASVERLSRKCVDRFDIELVNHFELEESLLFTAILQEIGPAPLVDELIGEHRQMERLIGDLRQRPDEAVLREFTALLRAHIRREENVLFQEAQERLSAGVLEGLGAEFSQRTVKICLEPE